MSEAKRKAHGAVDDAVVCATGRPLVLNTPSLCVAHTVLDSALAAAREAGMEEALRALDLLATPAHTYSSENADHYRGFDAGVQRCQEAIRARIGRKA